MNGNIVSHRNIVTDFHDRTFIKSVKDTAVLDIYSIPDADRVHIATKDGIEPNATILPDSDITYDSSIFGKVSVFTDLRGESSD
jgi:hypothetical protein